MVYESDFYTRRPYRAAPSLSTYTVTRRAVPWDKVPFVPRPSLVPDPITAFGKKRERKVAFNTTSSDDGLLILTPLETAKIKPKLYLEPLKEYVSARDVTREKVLDMVRREAATEGNNLLPRSDAMDVVLPRLHRLSENPNLPYKQRIYMSTQY